MPLSVDLGPVPGETVDEFIAAQEAQTPGLAMRRAGRERLLGRDTVVVEYARLAQPADFGAAQGGEGSGRMWIDPERMIILRNAGQGEVVSFVAAVTSLRYPDSAPDDTFVFVPPADSWEGLSDDGGPRGSGSAGAPPGFLPLPSIPAGFALTGVSDSGDGRGGRVFGFDLRSPGGTARLRQERGGPPFAPPPGAYAVDLAGRQAYLVEKEATRILAWEEQGGLVVRIEGDGLELGDILRLAEALLGSSP
jgi:hypothetical protein